MESLHIDIYLWCYVAQTIAICIIVDLFKTIIGKNNMSC